MCHEIGCDEESGKFYKTFGGGINEIIIMKYFLHIHKESRLGQWHDLQNLILTPYFYKIFIKKWYMYILWNYFLR